MEDESIPDESIRATSYIEDYFPWYARVNRTRSNYLGAAWCTNITSGNQSLTVSTKPWFLLCFKSNFNSKSRSTFEPYLLNNSVRPIFYKFRQRFSVCLSKDTFTVWKVSKYRAFSSPYFPVFGLNTEIYGVIQENTDQKKLRLWTLFTQCLF